MKRKENKRKRKEKNLWTGQILKVLPTISKWSPPSIISECKASLSPCKEFITLAYMLCMPLLNIHSEQWPQLATGSRMNKQHPDENCSWQPGLLGQWLLCAVLSLPHEVQMPAWFLSGSIPAQTWNKSPLWQAHVGFQSMFLCLLANRTITSNNNNTVCPQLKLLHFFTFVSKLELDRWIM